MEPTHETHAAPGSTLTELDISHYDLPLKLRDIISNSVEVRVTPTSLTSVSTGRVTVTVTAAGPPAGGPGLHQPSHLSRVSGNIIMIRGTDNDYEPSRRVMAVTIPRQRA